MATTVRLKLPPKWNGEPSWVMERYPDRTFDFDTIERAASGEEHRALFIAVGEVKKENRCGWFRCTCRDDIELAVMVRLRKPPYLALMPGTSLQHDPSCAFHRAPITLTRVPTRSRKRTTARCGCGSTSGSGHRRRKRKRAKRSTKRRCAQRQVQRQLNKFGLDGMLRLLFSEAGTATDGREGTGRPQPRRPERGSRSTARLLQTLGWIDAQGQRSGALKAYTRIGMPGSVAAFDAGTVIALVDVIEKIEPSQKYNWKCYLAGWGENFLIISPAQVRALLAQLRFHPTRAETTVAEKLPVLPRPTETWWGSLLVEPGHPGKWYRVLDHAALRTDRHGIPAESLDEIEMTQHLIDEGRAFCKPLFPGDLLAVPKRRPDFILEDTAQPCCIEVAGLSDVYDYNDRDDVRQDDYRKAGVPCQRWKPGQAWPMLDGAFRPRSI